MTGSRLSTADGASVPTAQARAAGSAAPARGSAALAGRSEAAAVGSAEELLAALDRAGCRVTEPRRAVAGLVAARNGHFSAADLVADARRLHPGIGRATIFRALDLFASLGLVERVDLPAGDHAYVACDAAHHHHAICTGCGRSIEVDDRGLADVLAGIGGRSGFRVTTHRLEVFGLCSSCLAGGAGR